MQEIDEQFYKYPKMLMMADSYVSMKTGEFIPLGEIEKNVYVIMKARNEYFDSHYDKQSDIAEMCNISLRKAAGVIREFMGNGIIEGTKVYSGGKHKNLKYTKVHCLELIKKMTETNESGKILSTRLEPMGKLSDSLWVRPAKQAVKSTITPESRLPYWEVDNDDSGPF